MILLNLIPMDTDFVKHLEETAWDDIVSISGISEIRIEKLEILSPNRKE